MKEFCSTEDFLHHCLECYDKSKDWSEEPIVISSWDKINQLNEEDRLNTNKNRKVTFFDGWVNIIDVSDGELLSKRHEERHGNESIYDMLFLEGFSFMVIPRRFCVDRDVFGKLSKEDFFKLEELCTKYNLELCSLMKRKNACTLQVECYEESEYKECFLFSYEINKKYGEL